MQNFREIPQRLRRLMQQKKIKACEIARKLELNPATICRYLKGERIPALPTIERIENLLGGKIL